MKCFVLHLHAGADRPSIVCNLYVLISCREKFHALDRNNFRSKDWGEVAKEVNTHCANEKTHKTQEQCRMKVDSLKKRYRQVNL